MGYLSTLGLSAVCILVAYYARKVQRTRSLKRTNGCQPANPYPHKDPFFGLDLFFQTGRLFKENKYLPELVRRYGRYGSTFETKSFGSMAINSVRPENLQTVWVTKFKDWGVEPVRLPAQSPFCGRGFITTDGPRWEHSRALLKPSFSKANMTDLSMFGGYVRMALDQIPRNGSTVDLQPLFSNLYLDTATLFLFGESFDSLAGGMSSDAREFLDAFDYAMFGSGFQIALGPLKSLYRDPKWHESCRTTHAFADKYVDKALEYRRNLLSTKSNSSGLGDRQQRHIMLHAMAEQTDDKIELRNEILQALMAAQETTAVFLSNAFFLLSRHPLVWQRLRNEIIALGDSVLDVNTLQNMKYLSNVLNETLRLYPVFPQMNRVALAETTLPVGGGHDGNSPLYVPKGTMFDTSFYVLHRLQSIWGPDADVFDPDRWDIFKPGTWEFLPFGGGLRGCAARLKAITEASYVVVRVLQEFCQIESRDTQPWTGQVQLTAKNANGCKVALTPA